MDPKLIQLDLVFAMDCTGSMGSFIQQSQESIRSIADEIVRQEKADLHLALVEYRDHPPQDSTFVTNVLDFTWSLRDMKARLDACSASGGGDTPEAVADAMHALLKLSWRSESTKVCIFIADAPPHGLGCSGDGFPEACPCGLDPMVTIREIAEKGITMYMVGCEPSITPYKDWFQAMAYITGGQYVPLTSAKILPKVIVSGTQEEISLQRLLKETTEEVLKLSTAAEGSVVQENVEAAVFEKLKSSGASTKHLKAVDGELSTISQKAIEVSEKRSMAEVRQVFNVSQVPHWTIFGVSGAPGMHSAAVSAAAPGACSDYCTVVDDVSYEQAARLTRRALNITSLSSKCVPASSRHKGESKE